MNERVTHIAGLSVTIGGQFVRQRCAWCQAILIDYDLERLAVPESQKDEPIGQWGQGSLVTVEGGMSYEYAGSQTAESVDGIPLPDDACAKILENSRGDLD